MIQVRFLPSKEGQIRNAPYQNFFMCNDVFFSHWEMCVRVRVHVCVRSHKFGMLQESFKCHWKPSTGHKRINSGGTFPKFCWVVAEKTCLLVTLRIQNHRISRAKQLSGNGARPKRCNVWHFINIQKQAWNSILYLQYLFRIHIDFLKLIIFKPSFFGEMIVQNDRLDVTSVL